MAFYPDIIDMFNRTSGYADDVHQDDDAQNDGPFGMSDMQEWADSLAAAGGVLGAAYGEADMLAAPAGQYMREEEQPVAAPVVPAFNPDECTVLSAPMTLRRGRITIKSRMQ